MNKLALLVLVLPWNLFPAFIKIKNNTNRQLNICIELGDDSSKSITVNAEQVFWYGSGFKKISRIAWTIKGVDPADGLCTTYYTDVLAISPLTIGACCTIINTDMYEYRRGTCDKTRIPNSACGVYLAN